LNVLYTVLTVVGSVGFAVGLFLLLRRFAPEGSFFSDGDRAAGVFGVLATGFSVLLGFVIFLAFTSYDTARSGARTEAVDVVQMFETAQLMPRPASAQLSGELICYGRAVINVEWPLLETGQQPDLNPWGVQLFRTLRTVVAKTAAEQAAYSKWLDQTSDREQARLDRVQAGAGVIPGPLWLILAITGILVALYALLFADPAEHFLPQGVIAGTIAAMLAISVLVIRFLDNPYTPGFGTLKPTEMQRVLGQIDSASQALGVTVKLPCDADGRPL